MRSKLVSRAATEPAGQAHGHRARDREQCGARHETSVPGNALEALIGALFLDKGFDRTRKAMVGLDPEAIRPEALEKEDRDNKSRLLEWGQKKQETRGVPHHRRGWTRRPGKTYVAEVKVDGQVQGKGRGNSKKKAEQEAADQAFAEIQERRSQGRGRGRGRAPRRSADRPESD
jgi:ribonuclease-3